MRDYEGYALYNKKTDKIVKVYVFDDRDEGLYITVFPYKKGILQSLDIDSKNEEIRKVRVIPKSHFE